MSISHLQELKIAEMLCTRLCHDLTGPIGAVNNGAEFLCEEGFHLQNQAVELVVNSAAQAVHRLQFYRQAYGRVNHSGEACLSDIKRMAAEFFQGTKITLDWPDAHTDASGISVGVKMARLVINLILITSHALIRGGTVMVRLEPLENGGKAISITGEGTSVKWEREAADAISGKLRIDQIDPKTVQFALCHMLSEELDVTLTVQAEEGRIAITALQPGVAVMQPTSAPVPEVATQF